jgi:hypothetical protein
MGDKKQSLSFFAILGFAALYLAFGFLYALDKRDTSNVLYEIFRGKVLSADQAGGDTRILLVGGSNTIWGLRSKIIEDETGIPTFNLALTHEAYDPKAMRTLTLSVVRPGDIVFYSSVSFWNSRSTDPNAAAELLRIAGLDDEECSDLCALKRTLDRYWSSYPQKNTIATSIPALYRRYIIHEPSIHMQGLNDKGDLASCTTPGTAGPNTYADPAELDSFLQPIKDFEQDLHMRGASLVLAFPPTLILPEEREKWIRGYTAQFQVMQRQFTMALPSLESSLYMDPSYFCDTGFHLADAEAAQRSRVVGQFLAKRKEEVQTATGN